jgi:hypothetical protein
MLYTILKHAHSGFRWMVLLLLLAAVANAIMKWRNGASVSQSDRRLNLFALVFSHLQFLIGIVLYFISERVVFSPESMKVAVNRFFLVEHPSLMIFAVLLITIGYSRAKRATSDAMAFRRTFWFYLVGLVLILLGIPWPMQGYGTGWF